MVESFDVESTLTSFLESLDVNYSPLQILCLKKYLDFLYERNKHINLVGSKDRKDIFIRHFLDCLSVLKLGEVFLDTQKIIDVGSGAGLPGILLAIFLQDCDMYLLEKRLKKVNFLHEAVGYLGLKNVKILSGRAEDLAHHKELRERFDLVMARAVARFDILCELTIPFCKIGGRIIFYKSRKVFEELKNYGEVVSTLGGKVLELREVEVPSLDEFRAFLVIVKIEETLKKFPRSVAKMR
ncbi:MAG: 16S rRNA (guanine(527)-N(7))-methyltransferase RsmG, partial [Actinobacteria bacterium]|nr:16S rRNA (guanine(527)-N(7))-methyltransferase RsmG [Actinomycetota bacterium]